MALLTLNLPTIGQSNATEDQKTRDALSAIQTGVNGNLDEANVPNLAAAFTTYKTVLMSACLPGSGIVTAANTFLMPPGAGGPVAIGAASSGAYAFILAPGDYAANARATMMRIRWELTIGAVAPGVTFTPGLYQVLSQAAASGVQMSVVTVGAAVSGSTVTYTTPAAGSNVGIVTLDFAAPAPGDYVLGFAVSGGMAAGSQGTLRAHLQYRQV